MLSSVDSKWVNWGFVLSAVDTRGDRTRLRKLKFSAKFPIGLHMILQKQIKKNSKCIISYVKNYSNRKSIGVQPWTPLKVILNGNYEVIGMLYHQSGQITGSGTCTRSGTVVPNLIIFSFVLPFIIYGDLIEFLEISSFSNIYWTCYEVQFKCEFQIIICVVYRLISIIN